MRRKRMQFVLFDRRIRWVGHDVSAKRSVTEVVSGVGCLLDAILNPPAALDAGCRVVHVPFVCLSHGSNLRMEANQIWRFLGVRSIHQK